VIDPAVAHLLIDHQSRLFQDPEMLGDRRTAHREPFGQIDDGPGAFSQAFEDPPPGGVGEPREGRLVSCHLR
jgi:hypothetical protein